MTTTDRTIRLLPKRYVNTVFVYYVVGVGIGLAVDVVSNQPLEIDTGLGAIVALLTLALQLELEGRADQ